jgi:hypothetical protein
MKTQELLELQSALITCLTDPTALREFQAGAAAWKRLSFFDTGLMELMSSFYRAKRLDKITKVLPRTVAYLAPQMGELIFEFMRRHPPLSADSYTNGCQFYAFLRRRWRSLLPHPPFLPDLAYCELAKIGLERQVMLGGPAVLTSASLAKEREIIIRRRTGIRLHQCQHDIRPLFDPGGLGGATILHQPVCLVFSQALASPSGKIFRVDRELFVLLKGLKDWTKVSLAASNFHHSEHTIALLRRLEELGFLEARLCGSQ